jgi:Caudovirus prohead serine protease
MSGPGRELKAKQAALMRRHNVRPIERAPIPLLAPTNSPQIIEGWAATPDVDADRMSFKRGSLSWPADLSKLPLLVRHDSARVVGRIMDLGYDADGRLFIRGRVDDPEARRMGAFSIAATVVESEVRDEDSVWFHFVITRAVVNEISVTDRPSNARAIVTSRRDVGPMDDALSAVERFRKALDGLVQSPPRPPPVRERPEINAAPAHIYGELPTAMLRCSRAPFAQLIAQLPIGGD